MGAQRGRGGAALLRGRPLPPGALALADPALMPVSRKVWSSWNFLGTSAAGSESSAVCVSYWVNRLQVRLPVEFACKPPSLSFSHGAVV
jgi:hypothetical protein